MKLRSLVPLTVCITALSQAVLPISAQDDVFGLAASEFGSSSSAPASEDISDGPDSPNKTNVTEADNPLAAISGPSMSTTTNPSDSDQVSVVRLRHLPVERAATALREIFPDWFKQGLSVEPNAARSLDLNLIVIRDRADRLQQVREFLSEMDTAVRENDMPGYYPQTTNSQPSDLFGPEYADASDVDRTVLADYRAQIRELANRYAALVDKRAKGYDASGEESRKVAKELSTTIERLFDARQRRQPKQVQRLRQRLATVQTQLREREKNRGRAIERARNALLSSGEPLRWQQAFDALGLSKPAAQPNSSTDSNSADSPRDQESRNANTYSNAQPTGIDTRRVSEADIQRLTLDLEAAHAELEYAVHAFQNAETLSADGTMSESELRRLELARRLAELKVRRAEIELNAVGSK